MRIGRQGQVRLVRSGQITSGQIIHVGQIRKDLVQVGQVRSGQSISDQAGQVSASKVRADGLDKVS